MNTQQAKNARELLLKHDVSSTIHMKQVEYTVAVVDKSSHDEPRITELTNFDDVLQFLGY